MKYFKEILNWLSIAKPEWNESRKIEDVTYKDKKLLIGIIQEEVNELKDAILTNNKVEIIDGVADVIWTALNSIPAFGISEEDFFNGLNEVLKSNQSKYCKFETDAWDACDAYSRGTHPSKLGQKIECTYKKVGDKYAIFRKSDGKIMKSLNFVEPNITITN